jgi:hypothetical protein
MRFAIKILLIVGAVLVLHLFRMANATDPRLTRASYDALQMDMDKPTTTRASP